ncbi:myo-inosose-2 dehydratase [Asaia prunellae]|uniref:myo-inosose-2 dehydratase n=1 Tax=Asaia prunellae TaxID=610245 RepID=UPI0004725C6A|nr:myo-inosose-2 dehydratase [Asaia prunellae]
MNHKGKMPYGVRLGCSPLSWTNDVLEDLGDETPLAQCLGEMAKAGYAGTELGRKYPRTAQALAPILQEHGLALASGWYSGQLADRSVDEEWSEVVSHAQLLRALGCNTMVYGECGAMTPSASPLDEKMSRRLILSSDAMTSYATRLAAFDARLRNEYGIRLAYHHHLMMVAETFQEISQLFDALSADVGLLLDTGHAMAAGFDYRRLIDRYSARICHIHLKDVRPAVLEQVRAQDMSFNAAVRAGMFTVPGDGCVDFRPLAEFVVQSGYQGWMVVEAEQDPAKAPPFAAVTRARQVVESCFANAMTAV